jgi:hypothetical protein
MSGRRKLLSGICEARLAKTGASTKCLERLGSPTFGKVVVPCPFSNVAGNSMLPGDTGFLGKYDNPSPNKNLQSEAKVVKIAKICVARRLVDLKRARA